MILHVVIPRQWGELITRKLVTTHLKKIKPSQNKYIPWSSRLENWCKVFRLKWNKIRPHTNIIFLCIINVFLRKSLVFNFTNSTKILLLFASVVSVKMQATSPTQTSTSKIHWRLTSISTKKKKIASDTLVTSSHLSVRLNSNGLVTCLETRFVRLSG